MKLNFQKRSASNQKKILFDPSLAMLRGRSLVFTFFLNLVKYATHFTGQVKKKEKSRTNDASLRETVK